MKIKTALKRGLLLSFFFSVFFLARVYGQFFLPPVDSGDVVVSANINIDLHSQLSLIPPTVEVLQPSTVEITVLNSDQTPRFGRTIVIYIQGDATGITIIQPGPLNSLGKTTGTVSSSIPGSYTVCAKDITDGYDIFISDCKVLYVIPVPAPTMLEEPEYTKGHSNTVMWNMTGLGNYQYYVQVSTLSDFSTIKDQSGWISNLSYEFDDLENGKMYFYRVKARNAYGAEGNWSNVVFSVQDAQPPEIVLISISDIAENTNVTWDRNFTVNIKYKITDNIGILRREFWCIDSNNNRHDCIYTATLNGDYWDIAIQLKYLEKTPSGNLFSQYRFCVEASDLVNNVTRNCEAIIEIPIETPEEEIPPTVIPQIPAVTRIRERLEKVFDDLLLRLKEYDMTDVTITTTLTNVFVSFGLLLTSLGYLPHLLIQFIIGLLTLLGLRKKGSVSGYVYDSLTKEPIGQAIIRLYNEVHELIWTSVTDGNGYFSVIDVEDGEYYIEVKARNYTFPSKIIFGRKDFPLENVYNGGSFLSRDEKIPNFSIPMDHVDISEFRKSVAKFVSRTKYFWKILHILLFIFGLLLSIYAVHVTPVWWNYLILALYIPALLGLVYSFIGKDEEYGVVRDTEKNEVQGAIVTLNERDFGKLVSKRVTDKLGRYKFVVSKGRYTLSILNSDLKMLEEEKYSELEVDKLDGEVLAPDIVVKRLEDEVDDEELIEPLEDL